nr:immunoglobulin light chain junction region [Macaca mulatta]MOX77154.1 immunoglobulin light chain junction region [Macaca mulatta]
DYYCSAWDISLSVVLF